MQCEHTKNTQTGMSFKCSLRVLVFMNKLGFQRTRAGGNTSHNMTLLLFEILTLCES